ncbi:MAG: methyltransferase domain-containing protein [Candidatus Niyogibacteria bacterium]|nr:methyltransferase domain-containing protein [Candidatus Niyogibacteria bacterium]
MKDAVIFIKELWRGKDLCRILMNLECRKFALEGHVLDIGSGLNRASYHRFFKISPDAEIFSLDQAVSEIDFEKDKLPYKDNSMDAILIFNLLEHIYNYSFLLAEIKRVLKPGGQMIGAAPFLVGYHPDPHDYWRYTNEALFKIFKGQNFKNIEIKPIGRGPFTAVYSQVEFMLPRVLKIIKLPVVLFLDRLIFKIKPNFNREKFALGLFFSGIK